MEKIETQSVAGLISEKELLNRWKCHLQTLRYRVQKGQLNYVMVDGRRHYSLAKVTEVERSSPVRKYSKRSGTRKPRVERVSRKHNDASQSLFAAFKGYLVRLLSR